MKQVLHNMRVFDGERILENRCVVIDGGRIVDVADTVPAAVGLDRVDLGGRLLAPGFIDVQVNGGAGVLFNDTPTPAGIAAIGAAHRRYGTTGFLPTLISDRRPVMEAAIAATRAAMAAAAPGVLGLHLEGPYLNLARKGIHAADRLRVPEPDALPWLCELGGLGRSLVTVAPEVVPTRFISALVEAGVRVSIGHTAASYAQAREALAAGATCFTHLFNAMSPLTTREPGAVGAALEDPASWCGVIADGHHVHPTTLRIAAAAKPRGRLMLVTDAVHTVGSSAQRFELLGQEIQRRDGRVASADGTLAGSDLTMNRAVHNTVELVGLPLEESLRMAALYPAAFLGLDGELGRIRPGYRASLVLLDEAFDVHATWIDGDMTSYW